MGSYKGGESELLLCGLTMNVNQGEFVALVGPHDSGKNTLLQILCGILLPKTGSIFVPPHLRVLHLRYQESLWRKPLSDILYFGWMACSGVTQVEDLDEGTIELGLEVCKQLKVHESILRTIQRESRLRSKPSIAANGKHTAASWPSYTGLSTDSRIKLQLACAL